MFINATIKSIFIMHISAQYKQKRMYVHKNVQKMEEHAIIKIISQLKLGHYKDQSIETDISTVKQRLNKFYKS